MKRIFLALVFSVSIAQAQVQIVPWSKKAGEDTAKTVWGERIGILTKFVLFPDRTVQTTKGLVSLDSTTLKNNIFGILDTANVVRKNRANTFTSINTFEDFILARVKNRVTRTDSLFGRSATKIVAAYNSSEAGKQSADYVCDGINDEVEIQEALDTLTWGGKVMLLEGQFNIANTINWPTMSGIELEGQTTGWHTGGTFLFLIDSANCPMIVFDPFYQVYFSSIKNLTMHGNKQFQSNNLSHGIEIKKYCSDLFFENLGIFEFYGDGVHIAPTTPFWNLWIDKCLIESNRYGFYFNGLSATIQFVNLSLNYFSGNGVGIYAENLLNTQSATLIITGGNSIWHNDREGIILKASKNITIVGNNISHNGKSMVNTYDGILLEDFGGKICENIKIVANSIEDLWNIPSQRYGINITGSSDYVMLSNNNIIGNIAGAINYTSTGTHNSIAGNITGTVGDSSYTILKGLKVGGGGLFGATVTANSFTGSGAGLTSLNASNLASGTIPNARLSGTYTEALRFFNVTNDYFGDTLSVTQIIGAGGGITALNASNLSTGTVADGRLSGTYSNQFRFSNTANDFFGDTVNVAQFVGAGAGITGVLWANINKTTSSIADITTRSAGDLSSGTLLDARLSGTYSNQLRFSNIANDVFADTVSATQLLGDFITPTNLGTGYLPYKSSTVLINSPIFTDGINVGIGQAIISVKFSINVAASNVEGEAIRLNRSGDDNRYNSIYNYSSSAGAAYIGFGVHDGVTATSQSRVMTLMGTGNIVIGTSTPLHKQTTISSIATNLNAFNFIDSDININRTTVAQAIDTSSVNLRFTGTGEPIFSLVGKAGVVNFRSDSSRTFVPKLTAADTIRAGDYTTFSYFIPGGALVQSSDENIKTNIAPYVADLSKFRNITPRTFNFKKENFIEAFDEKSVLDSVTVTDTLYSQTGEKDSIRTKVVSNKAVKDSLRILFIAKNNAEVTRKSNLSHSGFLAQEFNQQLLKKHSKEINQQDVINIMWLKTQELEKRIEILELK